MSRRIDKASDPHVFLVCWFLFIYGSRSLVEVAFFKVTLRALYTLKLPPPVRQGGVLIDRVPRGCENLTRQAGSPLPCGAPPCPGVV